MFDPKASLSINITTATILRLVAWAAFFWALFLVKNLIFLVLVAVVIASAVEPAVRWFGRWRIPRTPAVLLVYLIAFTLFASLVPLFFVPVIGDLIGISRTLPEQLSSLSVFAEPGFLSDSAWSEYLREFSSDLQSSFADLSQGILQTAISIFGGFFSFILVIVLSFYLAVQSNGVGNFLRLIVPARHEKYVIDLWRRSERKIGFWVQGQLLLGVIVGVLVYLGLTILQVDYALVLALMAMIFELIPVFGPILAAVPAVLLGFADNFALGLMVVGFYIIIQQFENHLLYPLVVKKIVGLPSLVAILALVVGYQLAGFLGIILSVPVATTLMELLGDFEQRKKIAASGHV